MKISEYLTTKQAAEFLGINPQTLRNWEKKGKVSPHINPISNYRLYKKKDLEKLLKELENACRQGTRDTRDKHK